MGEFRTTASFRDPSGFLFQSDGVLYRQVNRGYQADYDTLMESGLYQDLVDAQMLVRHDDVTGRFPTNTQRYRVIQPEPIPFISYPYEWCFGQLRDAGLLTLTIQRRALRYGMTLKDASAFNIQFIDGRPIFIDTLSFERYQEGRPWAPYRQFCQHFLAPLLLMSKRDIRLGQLWRFYLDGIPLDLASTLLGSYGYRSLGTWIHVRLHARAQRRFAAPPASHARRLGVSRMALLGLLDSLESTIRRLTWSPAGITWSNYYCQTNYTVRAFAFKRSFVDEALHRYTPRTVWDLGANVGIFSRLASHRGAVTIAFDADPGAVEANYRRVVQTRETHLLPLCLDLTNPSSRAGWACEERMSLLDRGPTDMAFALALIHHLVIGNNVPLSSIAAFFARLCNILVIEFIPKTDSQVRSMLAARRDIFGSYDEANFREAFAHHFEQLSEARIPDSARSLYVLRVRHAP